MINTEIRNHKVIQLYFKIPLKISIFILIIIYIFFILILKSRLIKKYKRKFFYLKPILPESDKEYIVKEYHKSSFNSNHIRYNFQDLYNFL